MRQKSISEDSRVKSSIFPVSIFIVTFLLFAIFTTIQMMILKNYIDFDVSNQTAGLRISIIAQWLLAAAGFTLWTRFSVYRRYEKRLQVFADAARNVAKGDFSVYIQPKHTKDKADCLDVLFTDFNKMVEELGSIETLKVDFFSNVSHEIKTPLSVIQNYAQLLQRGNVTDQQGQEYTESILEATSRLSDLITNMLKLNKLEKQSIKPVPETYDVCQQLCECALQFEEIWEKKEIEFIADMEDRAMIRADAGLLELVWNNLLSNAMKFTPRGGCVTMTQTSGAAEITVTITDTGCGINEETMRHIFDKFYQGDTSHSTEGNGLGLALVQRILQLSDGSVTVKSTPNQGTAFTVKIPVGPEEEDLTI